MAGPLATIITQTAACTTLRSNGAQPGSLETLLEGIATACDTAAPAVATALRTNATALCDAVTVNTSHLAVALDDTAIPHLQRFLALSRAKRSVQIAALQTLLDQLTAQDG